MRIGEATSAPPTTMLAGFRNSSNIRAGLHGRLQRHAMVQELGKDGIEIIGGADERIVDAPARAAATNLNQIFFQGLEISFPQRARITEKVRQLLHAVEPRASGEWKRQLVRVEHVENEDVMTAMAQHLQATKQAFPIGEQVG